MTFKTSCFPNLGTPLGILNSELAEIKEVMAGGDVAFSSAVTQAPLLSPQNSPPPSRPPRQKRCAPSAQLHIPVTPHVIFLSNEAAGTGLSNLALLHINAQSWAARGRVVA